MSTIVSVFDRNLVRRHRDRAAAGFGAHDFLVHETAARLVERLEDITRAFPLALDLGCHGGEIARILAEHPKIGTLFQCDLSPGLAGRAASHAPGRTFVADEEWLPLAEQCLDLVLSNLSLHWVNDLPGTLVQLRRALRPGGLLLGSLLGGETLKELRSCLSEAELLVEGGLSPRFSPLAGVRDIGDLLARVGFHTLTVDIDTLVVHYADPWRLLRDLRGMGESNAVAVRRRTFLRRATLATALALYQQNHAGADGRVPATFQVITLTAWAPDPV
ncbi:methyltransferase domain-containing protein [Pararhodospirillum photometricum]|uniref:SAM-dependent methyltransferases n=1 Tax=Pararhodospirillum photometricum DSM 122 TaxID=1150469 RepID=H6SJF3_PARPM|nr:methyltransferase domain-containing protein [Pararhodospirillum photometricum]CCG08118.1 SAM-dependent methyltransferases [Pararhodospirillum photometricum DSM 122]